jgi:peptide-methionine (R)-S-oxide reductase
VSRSFLHHGQHAPSASSCGKVHFPPSLARARPTMGRSRDSISISKRSFYNLNHSVERFPTKVRSTESMPKFVVTFLISVARHFLWCDCADHVVPNSSLSMQYTYRMTQENLQVLVRDRTHTEEERGQGVLREREGIERQGCRRRRTWTTPMTRTTVGAACRGAPTTGCERRQSAAPGRHHRLMRMMGAVMATLMCVPGSGSSGGGLFVDAFAVAMPVAMRMSFPCGHYYHRTSRRPQHHGRYVRGSRRVLDKGSTASPRRPLVLFGGPCPADRFSSSASSTFSSSSSSGETPPAEEPAAGAGDRNRMRRRAVMERAASWAALAGGAAGTLVVPHAGAAESPSKVDEEDAGRQLRFDDMDDDEWKRRLSEVQYYILREGGTEPRYSSGLVDETRRGTYRCAGCGSDVFESASKFESGTGWPSFAYSTANVEVINAVLPPAVASALGAGNEIKCRTCRGHLGEVFYDGKSFPDTPAERTGLRYCTDGAALVFYPLETSTHSSSASFVRGDKPSDYAATRLD